MLAEQRQAQAEAAAHYIGSVMRVLDETNSAYTVAMPEAPGRWSLALSPLPPKGVSGSRSQQYQIRVAGPYEYLLTGGGTAVQADGLRVAADTALDAKFVDDPARSPYVLPPAIFLTAFNGVLRGETEQFDRYGRVLRDPCVPVKLLEVITPHSESRSYFEALLAANAVPGYVRIVP